MYFNFKILNNDIVGLLGCREKFYEFKFRNWKYFYIFIGRFCVKGDKYSLKKVIIF